MSLENPFLTPPQVESPQSRSWGLGWAYGFTGPDFSTMTPDDIEPEDLDAFDQGVLAGQDSAINGLEVTQPCIDLNVEGPAIQHFAGPGIESGMAIYELTELAFAGAVLSGVLLFVELSIALETFSDDPNERLQQAATALQTQLEQLGFNGGGTYFLGGGVDLQSSGCELLMTRIFRDQDSAASAAAALGRAQWVVVSWQSNQSGGVTVVASSDD